MSVLPQQKKQNKPTGTFYGMYYTSNHLGFIWIVSDMASVW